MIYAEFTPQLKRYLEYPDFVGRKMVLFGFQDIDVHPVFISSWASLSWRRRLLKISYWLRRRLVEIPPDFSATTLSALLRSRGAEVDEIDLFDERANLHFDMNRAIGATYHEQYDSLIDIGSLEHLFDTRQAMDNCLRMIKVGGYYLLCTPVKGYFGHGFHTFNPEALRQAIALNGFHICDEMFTDRFTKMRSQSHRDCAEASIWLLARKHSHLESFVPPQQRFWAEYYNTQGAGAQAVMRTYRDAL